MISVYSIRRIKKLWHQEVTNKDVQYGDLRNAEFVRKTVIIKTLDFNFQSLFREGFDV